MDLRTFGLAIRICVYLVDLQALTFLLVFHGYEVDYELHSVHGSRPAYDRLAFNTIVPTLLQTKLTRLSVPSSICQWITSFLTDRHQLVKLGKFTSNSRTTSTGTPRGCVLSPLRFSLYTNDCTTTDPSVKLLKFADDTTVIGLIQASSIGLKRLSSWLPGAVLTTWSSTHSKQWR
ncbi:hypothetical protein QTP70_004346 [Hemibagrus guttatus]|uniref:Reverse transcriptase domain-containing protein n=1 Tax=Hemibagrus guttatus TaxID=175788 RepID=A0AAE0UX97_9TELE|nr:hypothetical protein QTP70_004346 [Hemibagrus guttatus]